MPSTMSGPEQRFARAQARVGLGGALTSLPVKWINHPSALADAEYKPRQLHLAQTVGLRVPATIVTNAPDEVRRFAAQQVIRPSLSSFLIKQHQMRSPGTSTPKTWHSCHYAMTSIALSGLTKQPAAALPEWRTTVPPPQIPAAFT
jgi:hypothetical protein